MTQEVKIPNDRIGAIIGKGGDTRKFLEKILHVTLEIDSQTGLVEIINEEDSLAEIRSMEVIKAIGRGFSPEHVRRGGAYMQCDRKMHEQQGQGLGLAIAKSLIELHGGTLTIQSEPGLSTTVIAKLPMAQEA